MQRRLSGIQNNPIPQPARAQLLTTGDGVRLRVADFPTTEGRKGTVCILQGRGEFIEKYFETINDLRNRGFSVVTFDWRGQGGSERLIPSQKGHVDQFEDYLQDLDLVVKAVMLPDCPPPYFALTHSTGGLVLLHALLRGMSCFERAFISSPLLRIKLSPSSRLMGRLSGTMNALGFGTAGLPGSHNKPLEEYPFAGNFLTSDPARLARNAAVLKQNRWLSTGVPTFSWLHAASKAMAEIHQEGVVEQVHQPILIVTGSRDLVVDSNVAETFARRIRAGGHISLIGGRHELMQERDQLREQWLAAFDAFIPGTARPV